MWLQDQRLALEAVAAKCVEQYADVAADIHARSLRFRPSV
jgi:hypothetical protein